MIITTDKEMRDRDPFDFYPTPAGLCDSALALVDAPNGNPLVLDPGAGAGPWGQAARRRWPGAHIRGVEVRDVAAPDGYSQWFPQHSYLRLATPVRPSGPFKDERAEKRAMAKYEADLWMSQRPVWRSSVLNDLIIGNPPYELAEEFVRQSFKILAPGGTIVFLFRLAFLEGQERGVGLWREFPPIRVATCSRRPSFTGNGKTDSTAYACFYWRHGHQGDYAGSWLRWDDVPVGQEVMALA